jgi:hypothetical protein
MITVVQRPYLVTVGEQTYPISSDQAQLLIDSWPVISVRANRVVLLGVNGSHNVLVPATVGGGAAFYESK